MMQFQRTADEMTGITSDVSFVPTWSDIAAEYKQRAEAGEAVEPVGSMVDYDEELMDYDPEMGHVVSSVARPSAIEEVVYYFSAVDDWAIVFNTFNYPGWRAYLLDGAGGNIVRELPIVPGQAILDENIPGGRITVPVPRAEYSAGGGHVLLRFEETPAAHDWPLDLAGHAVRAVDDGAGLGRIAVEKAVISDQLPVISDQLPGRT